MPFDRQMRYMEDFGLSEYDSGVLTLDKPVAEYYDECLKLYDNYKGICNWLTGDIMAYMNANKLSISDIKITPKMLTDMVRLVDSDKISSKIGKMLVDEMLANGGDPNVIVEKKGWIQISDEGAIDKIVEKILASNPDQIESYKSGKTKVIAWLVGQVMKESKGKANPKIANQKIREKLGEQ